MLLNPAIMALILVSGIVTLMLILASAFAMKLIYFWDIKSGSERQLGFERQTYLISTLLTWAFVSEIFSVLLFIYNAESMSGQFVGAMCATGVLNVNEWGWPTLFLKIGIFFSGAAWLALNHLDNQGRDYPLIKLKYSLLLLIVPLVILEFVVQLRHFLEMDPAVITSCCGSLFSAEADGVVAEVSGLQPKTALLLFWGSGTAVLLSGIWYAMRRNQGPLFAVISTIAFGIALVAIVSFVSLYIYEHPHHHCPFCLLKAGHGYVGYLLYIPLFSATALALATGVRATWKKVPSLADAVDSSAPHLVWTALILFVLFYLIAGWSVVDSNLVMSDVWW
ncbi:MAG: hypothetical protein ABFS39_18745 [Pseudomonadota bacterium]